MFRRERISDATLNSSLNQRCSEEVGAASAPSGRHSGRGGHRKSGGGMGGRDDGSGGGGGGGGGGEGGGGSGGGGGVGMAFEVELAGVVAQVRQHIELRLVVQPVEEVVLGVDSSSSHVGRRLPHRSSFVSGLPDEAPTVMVVLASKCAALARGLVTSAASWGTVRLALSAASRTLFAHSSVSRLGSFTGMYAMYAVGVSGEGDYYSCVPRCSGVEIASVGASEPASTGAIPAVASLTFIQDSGATRCFFRDSTTVTPLSATVAASCSCWLLTHLSLLLHHRLGHPSLQRIHHMHWRLLCAAPHSSSFPPTTALQQTLHMDVSLALVGVPTPSKLSPCTIRCIFLGFPTDASDWQFYHPATRHVLSSHDVTFDKPVDPLPLPRPTPSRMSQVTPLPPVVHLEVLSDPSGPAEGVDPAADNTAASRRSPRLETPPGFPPRLPSSILQPVAVDPSAVGGGDIGGAGSGGAGSEGTDLEGAVSGAFAAAAFVPGETPASLPLPVSVAGGSGGAVSGGSGAGGVGGSGAGGAGGAGAGGASSTGAGGARGTRDGGAATEGVGRASFGVFPVLVQEELVLGAAAVDAAATWVGASPPSQSSDCLFRAVYHRYYSSSTVSAA
ncbi:unnamed protein product [Closterium sp. NIES-53]